MPFHLEGANVEFPLNFYRTSIQFLHHSHWIYTEFSWKFPWDCHWIGIEFPVHYRGISSPVTCKLIGISVEISGKCELIDFHGISMEWASGSFVWYRHRVPLILHADDENVDSHMQWKRHDNVSAASGQYPCQNQNELQLCCTKCQAVTFQRPEDSRQLTDAACWCRSQTVPTENKTCFSVVSGWRETISKQKLSDYHASWGWQ